MKPTIRIFLRNWWPVAVWLGVIRLESTSLASSRNTFRLLYRVLHFFFERIDLRLVFELDHVLRKSGHFIGYAVLSGLTYVALRNTYRDRFRPVLKTSWGNSYAHYWQWQWPLIAVGLTIVTAALDEIHQAYLPFRTSRWQDVLIDTSGALALQVLIYIACQMRFALQSPNAHLQSQPSARHKLPVAEGD